MNININLFAVFLCLVVGSMNGFDIDKMGVLNLFLSFINLIVYTLNKGDEKEKSHV